MRVYKKAGAAISPFAGAFVWWGGVWAGGECGADILPFAGVLPFAGIFTRRGVACKKAGVVASLFVDVFDVFVFRGVGGIPFIERGYMKCEHALM